MSKLIEFGEFNIYSKNNDDTYGAEKHGDVVDG
jgi:hypothetical protein